MLRRVLLVSMLVLLGRCAPRPVVDCQFTKVAEMPLEVEDQLLVVPAGIDGKWVRLVVDSGAERTMVTDEAAKRLKLPPDPKYVSKSLGIGGVTTSTDVTIDRLVLGGVHFPVYRMATGTLNLQNAQGLSADGLIGADILLGFDLDIDVPGHKLTLYRPRLCPAARPPWPGRSAEIPGVRALKDRILLPFQLDNVPGMAVLDTGAQGNVLGVDMARRMGLDSRALASDPQVRQHGVGPGETISHLHQFSLLRIGPVAEQNPTLTVLDSESGVGDALIGEQFLMGRRVWLSFRGRQVFVSKLPGER